MVVVAALGTALRIAPGPHARVHGKDERFIRAARGERTTGEEPSQGFLIDPSAIQGGVKTSPATTMRRLQAQVGRRRGGAVRGEDGIGKLEEGVSPAVEAFVERGAEGAKSIGRFYGGPIMHPPRAFRILCRQRS